MSSLQRRVIVTGGGGLIGSHIAEELAARGDQVVVFDNFSRGKREHLAGARAGGTVEVIEADLRDVQAVGRAVHGADVALHFAAVFRRVAQRDPRTGLDVNVTGTLNVLEACVAAKVRRVVFASTASVYGEGESTTYPTGEEHPLLAEYFDGALKIAAEQLLKAYRKQHDLECVILRYANVYGPRQPFIEEPGDVVMAMLNRIESGSPPELDGDGSQTVDLVYATDAARAAVLAMDAGTSTVLNVGSGREITLRRLAKELIRVTVGESAMQPVLRPKPAGFLTRTFVDSTRARAALHFEPSVSLDDGIRKTIAWRESVKRQQACAG